METAQLFGQYARLRRELEEACTAPVWHAGRIERLTAEIVETDRLLADSQPVDEQTADSLPGIFR